ncbi:hypothetical protein POM88_047264 [Heracleum sosnowskyi]|uniref:Uncharacterized protein n=1 Tax=Heracleum sosnowskyi TaxID=360622 RepID=A0AAD8GT12_9APIA|nr:hypothetical protein POM88_047264 [Heracleum sosnowskyi]
MELDADPRPKAIHEFEVLRDRDYSSSSYGHSYHGFSHKYNTNINFYYNTCTTSFQTGSMFYVGYSKNFGVVFAKVVDGIDVLKVMDRMKGVERKVMRRIVVPEINVVCGQFNNDQCIKNHTLKNYGPKYHNIVTKKIPHQYVYRSGNEREDECRYSFRFNRLWSTFHAALSIVDKMPFHFMASLFRWDEVPAGNEGLYA